MMPEPITRPATLSLRLTEAQRAQVTDGAVAAGMSRHGYMVAKLMAKRDRGDAGRDPVGSDKKAVAAILAKLGQSRIANNLNQIAKALNTGTLIVAPEVEADIREGIDLLREVRTLLVALSRLSDPKP